MNEKSPPALSVAEVITTAPRRPHSRSASSGPISTGDAPTAPPPRASDSENDTWVSCSRSMSVRTDSVSVAVRRATLSSTSSVPTKSRTCPASSSRPSSSCSAPRRNSPSISARPSSVRPLRRGSDAKRVMAPWVMLMSVRVTALCRERSTKKPAALSARSASRVSVSTRARVMRTPKKSVATSSSAWASSKITASYSGSAPAPE
jgi:hypothetical protein